MARPERPVDPDAGPVPRFAVELRELRRRAGNPGYRELARRAHYSATTLAQAARGDQFPSLPVTLAYVRACGGDVSGWEDRWQAVATEFDPDSADSGLPTQARAPYLGLAAFQSGDSDLFFGRDQLISRLVAKVSRHRLVAVVGASGSGKTSLLRAGLLPATTGSSLLVTPGAHPLQECAIQLGAVLGVSAAALAAESAEQPANLGLAVRQLLAMRPADDECVLIVDQFEEVFTLCGADERDQFVTALLHLTEEPSHRTRVVLGLRSDFYGHCARFPALVNALEDAQVVVGPLTTDELRQAIVQPAARVACTVETALVARLVAEATGQAGVLPLVSHALLQTWHRRRGNALTLAGYEAAGGIHRALARSADQAFLALSTERQQIGRHLFLRLIAPGEGAGDTKRRIGRDELDNDPDTNATLEQLASARLITLHENSIELAHEALIRSWPRLRDWLADNRQGIRIHRQLTEAAASWDIHHRDLGALYRGVRLAIAQEWATNSVHVLSSREREFLDASLAAEQMERLGMHRRTRRLRRLVALLVALLLLASAAFAYAVSAEQSATQQRNAALFQKVIREAIALRATNPALAMQLALAAYQSAPTPDSSDTLRDMFTTPYATRITDQGKIWSTAVSPTRAILAVSGTNEFRLWDIANPHQPKSLSTFSHIAQSMRFSPDGKLLATVDLADAVVDLWDVADPSHPKRLGRIGGNKNSGLALAGGTSVAFSATGHALATIKDDGTMQLWDVTNPSNPQLVTSVAVAGDGASNQDLSVEFSATSPTLMTSRRDGTTRIWDVTDPRRPRILTTFTDRDSTVEATAFNRKGTVLATAGIDGTVRLWDVAGPGHPATLTTITGRNTAINSVTFNPEETMLAAAGVDGTIQIWDVANPRHPVALTVLTGHAAAATSVMFTPNGRTLVTDSIDRAVRLTDVSRLVLARHTGAVDSVAYSPDGKRLVTLSSDRSAHLWDVTDPDHPVKLSTLRDEAGLVTAKFSPDGRLLTTTSLPTANLDRLIQIWDLRTPQQPQKLAELPTSSIGIPATFSPDGRILATTRRLWDITNPHVPQELGSLLDYTASQTFSADGKLLATTDISGEKVRIWNVADPRKPDELATYNARAWRAEFSPTNQILATIGPGGATQLWDLSNPRRPENVYTLPNNSDDSSTEFVHLGLAFSPDGRLLATAGNGQPPTLWDIANPRGPKKAATMTAHPSATTITFSPDGTTIATAGTDHTVRLWDTDIDRTAARVCKVAYPRMTETEWDQYLPGLAFKPPCPH